MKLSIAIADENALDSAFVVLRGFEKNIPVAASLGYDGVELAIGNVKEINIQQLEQLLVQHKIEVSAISTGQVFARYGLAFTTTSRQKRVLSPSGNRVRFLDGSLQTSFPPLLR